MLTLEGIDLLLCWRELRELCVIMPEKEKDADHTAATRSKPGIAGGKSYKWTNAHTHLTTSKWMPPVHEYPFAQIELKQSCRCSDMT